MMRQQRVVGVSVYPVQYDAGAQELLVYETLTVTVQFAGGVTVESAGGGVESEAYEEIYSQMLLNYEEARGYRTGGMVEGLAVESEVEGIGVDDAGSWTVPEPGWRVKVREEGMYKLTYEELELAGFPVESLLDPGTLQMYNKGEEIAIEVELGGDSTFDAGDYVVFYGEGIESKYTLDNVYWLTYGKAAGLRMSSRSGDPGTADIPVTYPDFIHMEDGTLYLSKMASLGEKEHFIWGQLFTTSTPANWSTTFSNISPATDTASITVNFLGGSSLSANPDHHALVYLNENLIGDFTFDGTSWFTAKMEVPSTLFLDNTGLNKITVEAPRDLGLLFDLFYVDWINIEYDNSFIALNDEFEFSYDLSGIWRYQVSGFTSDQVQVYDVTNPVALVRITDADISGSGYYMAEFEDTISDETKYWTGTSDTVKAVSAIEMNSPSSLRSTANSAEYIIITHADFTTAAATLRDYRATQGMTAMVVDVDDVYDEFSYGIINPAAIHDFLAYAYTNWVTPAPSYVVLMGDGNYDPKDYLGYGGTNYIPPYLMDVDPWIQETGGG